ncbi:hypothetical protein KBY58_05325 [Cyanobium sp. HWJ4-Hawea]|uniref:hypothetical protein n=1 Tax=Cyanobium sp. HWJ4-Hawea TaxID=2823713 RepID=UPI0020CFCD51|nr:hypothetical protein [Cyanobium sp. HWJ4-Hawea]MCP9808848.1 hypothetical protein [Cyanobium sp. HWJ4-Hawea]
MTISRINNLPQEQPGTSLQPWFPAAMLGWKHPRKVAYIHRHEQLQDRCLYFWNHQENTPEPTKAQDLIFLLQDVYVETRGGFKSQKLVIDADLGLDGLIRLISGVNTTCATTLLSSLCALSPGLLTSPLALRLRPGTSPGVVMPALFVDNEWVDGRPMARDDKGHALPAIDLLIEVQTLLRHAMAVEMLPHQMRQARNLTA